MAAPDPERAGNPLGPQGPSGGGPIPAPGKPGAQSQGPGASEGAQAPSEPPRPAVDAATGEAITRLAAALEGYGAELEGIRRRQRSVERQLIVLFGVLAVIAWRTGNAKLKGVRDEFAPSPVSE